MTLTLIRTACLAALLATPLAQAHNVWLEPDVNGAYTVQFGGHEGKLESFPIEKLTSVHAYDRRGRKIDVKIEPMQNGARVTPQKEAAMLSAEFDNGFYSKVGDGPMINKPMNENPGATSGVHALKFHKTFIQWGVISKKELGQKLELIARTHQPAHAGQSVQFQVLFDGQPKQGVRVSLGEKGEPVMSDANGLVAVTPKAGTNQLQAILRVPVTGNEKTTQISYETLVTFPAH
ncbi:DUF4198 domain-containing protein [Diaphorobacter sp. HDW4A]|uniref:DUF4198 domain-containing protein n=1 Tax=Diaphorobacter sp. HDW4A TaxID=2714924 RepID=UPI0014084B78|nr:DUF4198 domain-containing protein [Diaphorobacter sp. HDW4A]QIL83544.1 DUF4198 domain-containing protein [Diaphorobacter sp. HDW4A]